MIFVRSTLNVFSEAFKNKDWELLSSVLNTDLIIDYSGIHAYSGKISSEAYILSRKEMFADINLFHFLTPLKIGVSGERALCKAYSVIYRFDKFLYYNTHAEYIFGLIKKDEKWLIKSIKQNIIWNDGNKAFLQTA
jgi:hypothetical protein